VERVIVSHAVDKRGKCEFGISSKPSFGLRENQAYPSQEKTT
jgi:hypothetical protein